MPETLGFFPPEVDGFLVGVLFVEGFFSPVVDFGLVDPVLVPRDPVDLDRPVVFLVEGFLTSGVVTVAETAGVVTVALGFPPSSDEDDEDELEDDNITAASATLRVSSFL